MATTNPISSLDPSFTSMINSLMTLERQPLDRLTAQKDTISVQQAVYTDLKGYLDGLQTSVRALRSDNAFYAFKPGSKASLSGMTVTSTGIVTTGTIATVVAGSDALPGSYTLSGVTLAKAHIVSSAPQANSDQALGLAGSFIIGGASAPSASPMSSTNDTVMAFGVGSVIAGQNELGSGPYHVETRKDPSDGTTWQFRLVDEDGVAVSIQNQEKTAFTAGWQNIPPAEETPVVYDSGRGLTFTFGADPNLYTAGSRDHGAIAGNYTSQGLTINVKASDSLNDIASYINHASYPAGSGVSATVVNSQLILTSKKTGANHLIQATDDGTTGDQILNRLGLLSGGSFAHLMQSPGNASFTLNGILVNRSQNTGLANVISGTTIDLANDAEDRTVTINITTDYTGSRNAVNDFISKFNTLQSYLGAKIAVTKQADNTYKRGALSNDSMFISLRNDLFSMVGRNTTNTGNFKNLREIGLTLDDNLQLKLSDPDQLDTALKSNYSGVTALLDAVMGQIDVKLGRYTGANSYVSTTIAAVEKQSAHLDDQIASMNQRLDARRVTLTDQYAQLQQQLILMQYTQAMMSTIYGSVNLTS